MRKIVSAVLTMAELFHRCGPDPQPVRPISVRKEDNAQQPDDDLLRLLVKQLIDTEVADFDEAVRQRIGERIGRAVFDPSKQRW
jgi:hypothetical protein